MGSPRPQAVDRAKPRTLIQPDGRIVRQARFDDAELNALRAADHARDEELRPFGPLMRRRLRLYVLGSLIGFPLASWLLTPVGFHVLWFQLPMAALYGVFVALVRPGMTLCAGATMSVAALIHSVHRLQGGSAPMFYMLLAMVLYAGFGAVLGFREHDRQLDR